MLPVIIEPIQGVGGLDQGTTEFSSLEKACKANDVVLILDEVQSGFGRSGKFLHINIMTSNQILFVWQKVWVTVFQLVVFQSFEASYGLLELLLVEPILCREYC
jgi:acetylornithine aminotransferase